MRNFCILLLVGAFLVLAGSTVAQAQGQSESQVFYQDDAGNWVANPQDPDLRLARLFRTGDGAKGACNKVRWEIPVRIHASIAQWIEFRLDWTQWNWYVRKPGCFAGNSIEAWVASNSDLLVDYEEFNDLMPIITGNMPLPVWYSFEATGGGIGEAEARGWVRAADLNSDDDVLLDSRDLHFGVSWKLWNKICVERCNSACEYDDQAKITLVLRNQKPWIEPETGGWRL